MSEQTHRHRWSAIVVVALLAALAATGCGQKQEVVCKGQPEHLVLVPSTSKTDYDVSAEMTPEVSKQVVRRVATSCGRITVGIQDGRPEANLELRSKALVPEDKRAYNAGAKTNQLVEKGDEFAQANLIGPLNATKPTGGSPFLSTMVKVGEEMASHDWPQGTIVLIGDGLVVERPPEGGPLIRFGAEPVSPEDLAAFVPLLKSLQGSCVVLVGAGATSKLSDHRIRSSQQLMGKTLEKAGVGFVATRSPEVPAEC